MTEPTMMRQVAPYPHELAALVDNTTYKNWRLRLQDIDRGQDCAGLTLIVTASVQDTYHPERDINILHYFPVPAAAFGFGAWQRWLFDRLRDVETHEAAEHFLLAGAERPYAPHHGPGEDPYIIFDHGTDEQVRTSFRGDVQAPTP